MSRALVRTDIQALRAVAVSLVLVFHLWPNRMPGGFVGVDVFFVISGFLISAHLLAKPPTGARDLFGFWARRVQRLLPASLLVLAATAAGSRLLAPDTLWAGTAAEIKAATLYVVNWRLAGESVDYLGAEEAPSPVQHYWSLAIEEQFYLGWPILLLLLFLLARRLRRPATQLVVPGIAAVVAGSLLYSVMRTESEPAAAYFVTPTRIWELAVGGLLAALVSRRAFGRDVDHEHAPISESARTALAWGGLVAIAVTAFTYSGATPFPGWQALLPVLGAAAVISVDAPWSRWSPGPVMALKPIQYLGDISYSVYLWHWPLVVLVPNATGHSLSGVEKLLIVVATLILAALTKTFVEDRFREARYRTPLAKPFLATAVAMAVLVALAQVQVREVEHREAEASRELDQALAEGDPCLGAPALSLRNHCEPFVGDPVPSPVLAAEDKSDAYGVVSGGQDCWSYLPRFPKTRCEFGDPEGDTTVALVGNSHAGQWLPTLQALSERMGLRITTHLASRCAMSEVDQSFDSDAGTEACTNWVEQTRDELVEDRPDVVLLANRASAPVVGQSLDESGDDYAEGYESLLNRFADEGLTVLALHDTPASVDAGAQDTPDCVAEHLDDYEVCAGPREDWEPDDPIVDAVAAADRKRVRVADLNDHICGTQECAGVVGGVVAYFDGSHMTATFARTLAPFLRPELRRAIRISR
ncbi:MAG: acyltransferase [Nocardioides sp.]|nr:acyltransferase [Nocardioides sp.]